jgi:hypothetical protein
MDLVAQAAVHLWVAAQKVAQLVQLELIMVAVVVVLLRGRGLVLQDLLV